MQKYCYNNLGEFLKGWQKNKRYFALLKLVAQLSKLFSENNVPYLDYRLAENLFCRCYQALNDARSCTAYDARIASVGIGIKTFILGNNDSSVEKIAEFNKLKKVLDGFRGIDLARKLGEYRNDRMRFANDAFGVNESQYHIVGRKEGLLRIFNCPYEEINLSKIHLTKDDGTSVCFNDEENEYSFNISKSVLMKRFNVESDFVDVPVEIVEDPLQLLELFFAEQEKHVFERKQPKRGVDYVILPLYSSRNGEVPKRSGLNQWNASGRPRHEDEVYIPVPISIHREFPDFFPKRDCPFSLSLPDGKVLSAKICEDNGKALMSNPNRELGHWLLRDVLKKKPWTLVTLDDFNRYGFDSICVEKLHRVNSNGEQEYKIYFVETGEDFKHFMQM